MMCFSLTTARDRPEDAQGSTKQVQVSDGLYGYPVKGHAEQIRWVAGRRLLWEDMSSDEQSSLTFQRRGLTWSKSERWLGVHRAARYKTRKEDENARTPPSEYKPTKPPRTGLRKTEGSYRCRSRDCAACGGAREIL